MLYFWMYVAVVRYKDDVIDWLLGTQMGLILS